MKKARGKNVTWRASKAATACVLVAALCSVVPPARGQADAGPIASSSAKVAIHADIISSALDMTIIQPLQFGDVHPGMGRVEVQKGSPTVGEIQVEGAANAPVIVDYTLSPNGRLEHVSGRQGSIALDMLLFGSTSDQPGASSMVSNGSVITLAEDGRYYFYVGGLLQVGTLEQNPPGDYRGMMTMILSYQ